MDSRHIWRSRLSRRSLVQGTAAAAAGGAFVAHSGRVAAQDEPVELRWSMWSATEAELAVWQSLADDVTAAHPNITVTLETVSFTDYWDKLQTQLASGTEADIVAMQALRMPAFAVRDALRPLQPLINEDPDFDADDFFDVIQQGLSHHDEVYAFGYDLGPQILLYNKDLFDAKGVQYPSADEPMTWEQFRETAIALTDTDQREYGFTLPPTFDPFVPWLWSAGGGYMNEEETECTLDSPESLEALNFLYTLVTEDQAVTPLTDLANANFHREAFNSGNVGMQQDGPWQFVNTRKEATFDWDIAPIPAGSAGSITTVNGSGFGISNTTQHPEAAWQALKVITSTESLEKVARAGRGYPARQSAVPAFVDPSLPPEHVEMVERILTGEIAQVRQFDTTTTWQEIVIMLTRDFVPILLGEQTPEEIVADVVPNFNDLLERHQELLDR